MKYQKLGACSNKPPSHPPSPCTQDVPFLGQGRDLPAISRRASPLFGALSVHEVREGERRDERQACEREADKDPRTPLADFFNKPLQGRGG
ncbi:MAG: hypothetical protein V3U07_02700 [Nitrospirales bacterium]